jgi:mannose-6-phosphate isomerase-like protein (cupin superfamily)
MGGTADGGSEEAAVVADRATVGAARGLAPPPGRRSVLLMRHGSMSLRYYAPRGRDDQQPHAQDELYVVIAGSGRFVHDGNSMPFGPGDVLFAAAGRPHRFEDFTDDFEAWVVFYGPSGGEAAGHNRE